MVTYRPGSKNGKADALSRRFEGADEPVLSEPILPPTAILAPVRWNLVEEIQRTHAEEPPPAGCPPTKVFVPPQFRTQVIQWMWTDTFRLALPAPKHGPVVSCRRGCWSPFRFLNAPGPTCQ
ncbi:hypothetical protein QTP70_009867 [Hemibagrus guttatus]|uniref:Uncharacterized protein n=1 Tax=Hemibagrus guttatus TaxID=175788 RepID=A0AAE0RDL2_9TELE|nr:hypothetical protein QTP70_009867 [Hemibagrus guttatus]